MRRVAAIVVGIVIAAGGWISVAASRGDVHRFAYVGNDFYVVGPDLAAAAVWSVTGLGTAPLGRISFVPEDDQLTITVDDAAFSAGTVGVYATQWVASESRGVERRVCAPVHQPTTFENLVPGVKTWVTLYDVTYPYGCDHGTTTGVLTITGPLHP